MADQIPDPGVLQRLIAALFGFGQSGPVDQRAATAQQGAQAVAGMMPEAVMPREALERKRRERELMDAMMAEANR